MSYQKDLKKVMILYPGLRILKKDDYRHLINIHNTAESIFGESLNLSLVAEAFNNKDKLKKLGSHNDYYYLIFSTASNLSGIKKVAYPTIDRREFPREYDLDKWGGLVYNIYNDVEREVRSLPDAIAHHSSSIKEKEERESFERWVKYYNNGESVKYSKNKKTIEESMNKKADFNLNAPSMPSNYSDNARGVPLSGLTPDKIRQFVQKETEQAKAGDDGSKKFSLTFHRVLRRLDNAIRLGRNFFDEDSYKKLWEIMHQLNLASANIINPKTAADISYAYANEFRKIGFNDGYEELIKYSQQQDAGVSVDDVPTPPAETPPPVAAPATAVAPADTPAPAPAPAPEANQNVPKSKEELSTPLERALSPFTEQKRTEYESLAGDVDLGDAVAKLEDIAGRLSDRRTIRLLAEFDIILDKIGIAPMFPELAEAQSKLIDAYSYALVRVTKMLGMISSGKSILEISESKRNELVGKTLKEVNRGIEQGEATAQALAATKEEAPAETGAAPVAAPQPPAEKGPEATQQGLEGAGLSQPPEEPKA